MDKEKELPDNIPSAEIELLNNKKKAILHNALAECYNIHEIKISEKYTPYLLIAMESYALLREQRAVEKQKQEKYELQVALSNAYHEKIEAIEMEKKKVIDFIETSIAVCNHQINSLGNHKGDPFGSKSMKIAYELVLNQLNNGK